MALSSVHSAEHYSSQLMPSSSSQLVAAPSSNPTNSFSLRPTFSSFSQRMAFAGQRMGDYSGYLPLYEAIMEGDLESVKFIYNLDENVLAARITENLDTALHVAVGTCWANHIVKFLLSKMSSDQVALQNKEGNTVLSIAAIVGNQEAAKMIMRKDLYLNLSEVSNDDGWIPLMQAAGHGQKEMIIYLLQFSQSYLQCAAATCTGQKSAALFINLLIIAGFYDLALDMVKIYPSLVAIEVSRGESLLTVITRKLSEFSRGKGGKLKLRQDDYDSMPPRYIKETPEIKLMHDTSLQLVKFSCSEITKLEYGSASSRLTPPLLLAVECGVCEVVEEIIKSFPDAILFTNENNHNVLQLAVMSHQEKVFNFVYQMSDQKNLLLTSKDKAGNNLLHLAGKLAPENQLNLINGAALQMQRELLWFKKVEKIVRPAYKEDKNSRGQTPAMVFTKEHERLVIEGKKWVKSSAGSTLAAATTLAVVALIAAYKFPGDYKHHGRPNFYKQTAHKVFNISDALSLVSAASAIMMFSFICNASYEENDFLYVLPNRLIFGHVMIFLSSTSMIVAFGATAYLVYSDSEAYGVLGSVAAITFGPLSLFAFLHYPALLDLIYSTYGNSGFGKQSSKSSTESRVFGKQSANSSTDQEIKRKKKKKKN